MEPATKSAILVALFFIVNIIKIYSYIIIADALMSWFLPPQNRLRVIASRLSAPVVHPFRLLLGRLIPPGRGMMIDLSPALACLALQLVAGGLNNMTTYLLYAL